MIIYRNPYRTPEDDWKLNVQPRMGKYDGSLELRDKLGNLIGWLVRGKYE